jgi:hypothetical protein
MRAFPYSLYIFSDFWNMIGSRILLSSDFYAILYLFSPILIRFLRFKNLQKAFSSRNKLGIICLYALEFLKNQTSTIVFHKIFRCLSYTFMDFRYFWSNYSENWERQLIKMPFLSCYYLLVSKFIQNYSDIFIMLSWPLWIFSDIYTFLLYF